MIEQSSEVIFDGEFVTSFSFFLPYFHPILPFKPLTVRNFINFCQMLLDTHDKLLRYSCFESQRHHFAYISVLLQKRWEEISPKQIDLDLYIH